MEIPENLDSMVQRAEPVPLPGPGVTRLFLGRAGEETGPPGTGHLERLCRLFARFPYENVTKIIRRGTDLTTDPRFRGPQEVADGFLQSGAGGTCFSLTNLFLQVLADCGYHAVPFLAHMGRRENVHCGLIVGLIGGGRALVDPGYLVDRPLPLVPGRGEHRTGSARILLEGDGEQLPPLHPHRRRVEGALPLRGPAAGEGAVSQGLARELHRAGDEPALPHPRH